MAVTDSALDPVALAHARQLLAAPKKPVERFWPVLAAAGFAAFSALALAAATIMAPPPQASMVRDSNGQMVQPQQ